MDLSVFDPLPDEAQLWIMGFKRPLGEDDKRKVGRQLEGFLPRWHSHKAPVKGAFTLLEDRFAVIAASGPEGLSGCSMDSCIANFKQLKAQHGLDALNRALVFYRDGEGAVRAADRPAFQQMVDRGEVRPETPVFDTTLQKLGRLRREGFEKPFKESWHARVFRLPKSAGSAA